MRTKERCCLEAVSWRPGSALGEAVHLGDHTQECRWLSPSPRPAPCGEGLPAFQGAFSLGGLCALGPHISFPLRENHTLWLSFLTSRKELRGQWRDGVQHMGRLSTGKEKPAAQGPKETPVTLTLHLDTSLWSPPQGNLLHE